jgi:hypothetical protein
MKSIQRAAIGPFALALMACNGNPDVAEQRESWHERRPEQYVIETCGTGFVQAGCVVRAVNGESENDPVESMFDAVEDPGDCDVRELRFSPSFGYVAEYYLDCGEEGYGMEVRCFQANTLDVSRCGS